MKQGSLFKRLASGALLGALGFVLAAVATLWATPKVVNGLGLENYAVLGLLVGVQGGLLMVLSNSGQLASLVLLSGVEGKELEQRSQALSAWSILASMVALGAGWLLSLEPLSLRLWHSEILAQQWSAAAPWAGLGWAYQLLTQSLWAAQRARQRPVQAEGQQAVVSVVFVLAAPYAVLGGAGVQGAVEAQSSVWVLALIAGLILEQRYGKDLALFPKEHKPVFAEIRRLAFWSVLALAGGAVLLYADRLYSLQASARELAAWTVATALSLRVASGLGVLGPLLLPSLNSARKDPQRFANLQSLYLRCVGLLGLSFYVPLAAGGAGLLGAWIAPEVEQRAAPWIVMLAFSGLALSLNNAYFAIQMGSDGAKPAAFSALGSAVFGLLVGGIAQSLGWPGAAWMALSGQSLALLWRAHWLHRHALGRPGWGWVWQSWPWMLGASILTAGLKATGFPKALGGGFAPVASCFVAGGLLVSLLLLGLDAWVAKLRGRTSLYSQWRRLRPGEGA